MFSVDRLIMNPGHPHLRHLNTGQMNVVDDVNTFFTADAHGTGSDDIVPVVHFARHNDGAILSSHRQTFAEARIKLLLQIFNTHTASLLCTEHILLWQLADKILAAHGRSLPCRPINRL